MLAKLFAPSFFLSFRHLVQVFFLFFLSVVCLFCAFVAKVSHSIFSKKPR